MRRKVLKREKTRFFLTGTISVREILLRVEKLQPDRLKRTEHGKNTVKVFFICTVVSNINGNKAVNFSYCVVECPVKVSSLALLAL